MKNNFNLFWKKWKTLADRALNLQAKIILWIFYHTLLLPVGLWFRLTHDVLNTKKDNSNWHEWQHKNAVDEVINM